MFLNDPRGAQAVSSICKNRAVHLHNLTKFLYRELVRKLYYDFEFLLFKKKNSFLHQLLSLRNPF